MKWVERSMFLWPGLHRLWRRGDWLSLAIAVGFAVLLNLALIGTLIWPAWLGEQFPSLIWPLLILVWGMSLWSMSSGRDAAAARPLSPAETATTPQDTLFIQGLREYLSRNWLEAERLVRRRLQLWPRDAEARLLLATVLRQTGRLDLAIQELDRLAGCDESQPWQFEIEREREWIRLIKEQWQAEEPAAAGSARDLPNDQPADQTDAHETDGRESMTRAA